MINTRYVDITDANGDSMPMIRAVKGTPIYDAYLDELYDRRSGAASRAEPALTWKGLERIRDAIESED